MMILRTGWIFCRGISWQCFPEEKETLYFVLPFLFEMNENRSCDDVCLTKSWVYEENGLEKARLFCDEAVLVLKGPKALGSLDW